ncbi:MAG TPA: hypothetical protein ENG66_05950 [Thermococcus sp.]|nr:hypothetical protein [Thermococcus sp.]
MLALIGFTRFPIFYSSDGRKILGCECRDEKFREYILDIRDRKVVAIGRLANLRMRRRFVIEDKAINPSLKIAEETVRKIYVYPSYEGEDPLDNVLAMGIVLKGVRNPVFVPLISLKHLDEKEAQALLGISRAKALTIERMVEFLRSIGIEAQTRNLVEGIVVDIYDPEIDERYQVLVDDKGRVLDTNVCIEAETQLYLPEIVLLIRQRGEIFVYSRRW